MVTQNRFVFALFLVLALVFIGVSGFMLIEGWTFTESLYMTFITLTTVGFAEVRPLSETGRMFTVAFLIMGLGTAGYGISTLFGYIFEGTMVRNMKERRMELFRRRLNRHYIICGYGDVASEVVTEFRKHGVSCAVVDKDPAVASDIQDDRIVFVVGDASDEQVLEKARIADAAGLVSALPDDAGNLFVVLTARQMNPELQIVARASDEASARKMMKAGANRVVTPKQIAGRRMAASVLRPQVVNFLEVAVDSGDVAMRIEEFQISETSPLRGKTLRDTNIGQNTGAVIMAIVGPNGMTRYSSSERSSLASTIIDAGDILIAMGSEEQLLALDKFLKSAG